jgi:hypothetical protein
MIDISGIARASGLSASDSSEIEALLDVYNRTRNRNETIESYYDGDVMAKDIGVDILPPEAKEKVHVDLSCDWAKKAVKELAGHVRFDGFVFEGRDGMDEGLARVLARSGFESGLSRARNGVLKKGCAFATVNNFGSNASVTFHSADDGAAIMNTATGQMRSGFVFANSSLTEWSPRKPVVTQVNFHMTGRRVEIVRGDHTHWHAVEVETPANAMMMVPFAYDPTDKKMLGTSRITKEVQSLVDDVLSVRLAIALSRAFYAVPMRALLGLTEKVYNALADKPQWTAYINPMLLATADKQGRAPTLTQLPSNTPEPLIRIIETDAKMFAASTGIPLNSLGIVQDNPSSAEAIVEGRRGLIEDAQSFITEQMVPALRQIALLVMLVESNKADINDLDDIQRSVMPHFKNPAMPSVAATTDAAMKIASVNPGFASTDVFFEMVGFDQATISRVKSQMRMNVARQNIQPLLTQTRQGLADGTL